MPQFDCGNATLSYPSCSFVIRYCNNNYATKNDWCDCMINPPGSQAYGCNLGIFLGTIFGGAIGVLLLLFTIGYLVIKYKKTYNNQPNQPNQNIVILDKTEDILESQTNVNELSYQEQRSQLFAINNSSIDHKSLQSPEERLRPIATRPDRPIPDMTPMSVIIQVYPANNTETEIVPDYQHDSSIPPPRYNDSEI